MDDLGPDPEVLASRLEKEATLQVEVKGRFGVIPNFFRLTPEHPAGCGKLQRLCDFLYRLRPASDQLERGIQGHSWIYRGRDTRKSC